MAASAVLTACPTNPASVDVAGGVAVGSACVMLSLTLERGYQVRDAAVLVFDQKREAAAKSEVQGSVLRYPTSVILCVNDFTTHAPQAVHEATRPTEQIGRPR